MPCAIVTVSAELTAETQQAIATESAKILSKVIGKPIMYCMSHVVLSKGSFGGATDPCAFIDVKSIGGLSGNQGKLSKAYAEMLKKQCNIESDRVYLNFTEMQGKNWGYDADTF